MSTGLVELDSMGTLRIIQLTAVDIDELFRLLIVIIINVMVTATEVVVIGQLSLAAAQDGATGSNHLGCEGKLLAVEDQSTLVVIEVVLHSAA